MQMAVSSRRPTREVSLRVFPLHRPCEAFLFPVSGFPIPDQELAPAEMLVGNLASMVESANGLHSEVFIQVEQFDDEDARLVYRRYARDWIPEIGLGVWPDRDPPKAWTREEFSNLGPGEKIRPLMYQVLQITGTPRNRTDAFGILFGFGPLVRILTPDPTDAFLRKSTAAFLPAISDPSFTCFPFYIPLLEVKTLISSTPDQLEGWFCGASVYIRESFEDKGILVVSRQPLTPVLEQLGGRYEEKPEPHWKIPV